MRMFYVKKLLLFFISKNALEVSNYHLNFTHAHFVLSNHMIQVPWLDLSVVKCSGVNKTIYFIK